MGFLKIKYEQFLIRMFDRLLKIMKKSDVDWYPKHALCWELEDKLHDEELKNNTLIYDNMDLMERLDRANDKIENLENKIRDLRTEVFMP